MLKRTLCLVLLSLPLAAQAESAPPAAGQAAPTAAAAKAPVNPMTPVVRVNGKVLSAIHLSLLREERRGRGMPPGQDPEAFLRDSLINAELMAQEAERLGLDKPVGVQAAMELNRKELLGRALVEDFVNKHPVSEERSKAEYERLKASAAGTEYRSRHILVDDEKLAKSLISKLGGKKPAKFEDLAKTHSKDSSANAGGDLGWMSPKSLVPEFADAMVKLKKGQHTKTPVKTQFGWHVIKLDDSREVEFPAYERVKGRIDNQLIQNDIRQFVADLRAKAVVEIPSEAAPEKPAAQ